MKEISLRGKYLKLLGRAYKNRSLKIYATDFDVVVDLVGSARAVRPAFNLKF